MGSFLKSTTALVVSAALGLPAALAQGEADPKLERQLQKLQQVPTVTDQTVTDETVTDETVPDQAEGTEQSGQSQTGDQTTTATGSEAQPQTGDDPATARPGERKKKKRKQQPDETVATMPEPAADSATPPDAGQGVRPAPQTPPAEAAANRVTRDERARRRAERQARRADALSSETTAAAAQGGTAAETLQSGTVTGADVRSSAQEVQAAPAPGAASGLSNLGKAALLGLGALAVGQMLDTGERVVTNTGDRVVVEADDGMRVIKNDEVLMARPGDRVEVERFADGSRRSTVIRPNGTRVVTVQARDGRVLRRTRILPDGRQVVLFDDTRRVSAVQVTDLPRSGAGAVDYRGDVSDADLRRALLATGAWAPNRRFSLAQIRYIDAVRHLLPEIDVEAVTFDTGSAALRPEVARQLAGLGRAMRGAIAENPAEVFLVEGHTDAVGDAAYNLVLSDRRAETVALALTEYFDVPPENMVVQGYGESDLKVPTELADRRNRRVAVRRITPLLD